MPIMDGHETVIKLNELNKFNKLNKLNKKIPEIIMLTANALETEKIKFLKLGVRDYISKPFRKKDIKKLLEDFENSSQL